jgi:mRNA (2'-O-methyladenosine-N6-)-methyltransferase
VQFVKDTGSNKVEGVEGKALGRTQQDMTILYPPQWVQCDLRYLDMTVLGQWTVA